MKFYLLTILFLFFIKGFSQSPSPVKVDSLINTKADSLVSSKPLLNIFKDYSELLTNPYFNVRGTPVYFITTERTRISKDELFYFVACLLSFLAFIKLLFSKYFNNLFRLFFQPSFRQKQTREQLMQSNLPSLLFNLFFVASLSAYTALLLGYFNLRNTDFWLLFAYCAFFISLLYVSKYFFLSFTGWVFNVKEATGTYIFIVYLINKILGVVMVPFIIVMAFAKPDVTGIGVTVSLLLVCCLFIYRYVVCYAPVRREVKLSPLHFLFYVAAFEIIPLLLINKFLIIYLGRTM